MIIGKKIDFDKIPSGGQTVIFRCGTMAKDKIAWDDLDSGRLIVEDATDGQGDRGLNIAERGDLGFAYWEEEQGIYWRCQKDSVNNPKSSNCLQILEVMIGVCAGKKRSNDHNRRLKSAF